MPSRRYFVAALAAPLLLRFQQQQSPHPEPRPGIDGRNVLGPDALRRYGDDMIELFNHVREMPQVADGLRCYCGCHRQLRSLLSCFEDAGMATDCDMCQAEARLAWNRFREGQTLAQIRRAVEARFA